MFFATELSLSKLRFLIFLALTTSHLQEKINLKKQEGEHIIVSFSFLPK